MDEVLTFGEELLTVLDNDDTEKKLISNLKTTWKEVHDLREIQFQQIKDSVEALIEEEEEVVKEISKAKEYEEKLSSEEQKTQAELKRLKEEKERKDESKKARYDVNLFRNITRIRWQLDSEPEIKGYVINKKEVKPFSLNSDKVSKFFTANCLWDLVEEEW